MTEVRPEPASSPGLSDDVYGAAGRRRAWIAFAVIAAALGFLLVRGLGDATVYFLTADEAVAQRESLADRRFRIEGLVVAGSVKRSEDGVEFRIREGGETVQVRHQGDPPELFQPGIPVVLEGHWDADRPVFQSDRILVRHTEEYRAENPERVEDYNP